MQKTASSTSRCSSGYQSGAWRFLALSSKEGVFLLFYDGRGICGVSAEAPTLRSGRQAGTSSRRTYSGRGYAVVPCSRALTLRTSSASWSS